MLTIQKKLFQQLDDRIRNNLTTFKKAAQKCEISLSSMYRYKRDERTMNIEQYTKLQEYLNNLNK